MKNRNLHVLMTAAFGVIAVFSIRGPLLHAQGGEDSAGPAYDPKDKAAYFSHGDIETVWKDLEARQANNHRLVEGGKYVVYVRIVTPTSRALTHAAGADVWICEAGSAIAVTGGKLVNPKKPTGGDAAGDSIFGNDTSGSSIEGGSEQAFTRGDILYVPPGVPHTFKDMKGFRAYLIRFDVK